MSTFDCSDLPTGSLDNDGRLAEFLMFIGMAWHWCQQLALHSSSSIRLFKRAGAEITHDSHGAGTGHCRGV